MNPITEQILQATTPTALDYSIKSRYDFEADAPHFTSEEAYNELMKAVEHINNASPEVRFTMKHQWYAHEWESVFTRCMGPNELILWSLQRPAFFEEVAFAFAKHFDHKWLSQQILNKAIALKKEKQNKNT